MANLIDRLNALRASLATAAQRVLDTWKPDEQGIDPELGTGGVCDRITVELGNVIGGTLHDIEIDEGGQLGDDHSHLVVIDPMTAVVVDVPSSLYERGGGYVWHKIAGATIRPEDIYIEAITRSNVTDRRPDVEIFEWEDGFQLRRVLDPRRWDLLGQVKKEGLTYKESRREGIGWSNLLFVVVDLRGEPILSLACRLDLERCMLQVDETRDLEPYRASVYRAARAVHYFSDIIGCLSASTCGAYEHWALSMTNSLIDRIGWQVDEALDRHVPPDPYREISPDAPMGFRRVYPPGIENVRIVLPDEPWLAFGQLPPVLWADDELFAMERSIEMA